MSTEAKIPEADLKNVNLKPTETVEKVILPSAEGKFVQVYRQIMSVKYHRETAQTTGNRHSLQIHFTDSFTGIFNGNF